MEPKIINDYKRLIDRENNFLDFLKSLEGDSDAFLSEWLSNSLKELMNNPIAQCQKLDELKGELILKLQGTEYEEIVKSL